MPQRNKVIARIAICAALLVGELSLLLLMVFLVKGPLNLVALDVTRPAALGIDTLLCLIFFVQHSVMIRRPFRAWLGRFVPEHLHGALYAVASGLCLLALVVLWQPTGPPLASAGGFLRWLLRGFVLAALVVFFWGIRALGSFDALGVRPIQAFLRGKEVPQLPLTIRGPYRWVRHPLYTQSLIVIWCFPDLTWDRLLFNMLWTVWIIVGSVLEERDLTATFGHPYREYQRSVPMLIPWRVPRNR